MILLFLRYDYVICSRIGLGINQSCYHLPAASKSDWRSSASCILLISLYMMLSSAKSLSVLCCVISKVIYVDQEEDQTQDCALGDTRGNRHSL